ncbi:hypothetical protein H5410_021055 [Solanum commersonii]|uniref:Uncharacterized protein n=1 Tax=Solanum commersonii TaxID=4109 RepID=A0A9J5ZG20_SOLCO|nr:hypothetical protein H5410_021055 [Solanum commersonii]
MTQIVTAHKWYVKCTILIDNGFSITNIAMIDSGTDLYPPIILGTPFINAIYPFTNINAKGFSATYKNQNISYTFITEPISRNINALIEMKQKHAVYLQLEIFSMNIVDTLKSAKVHEKIKLISEKMAIDICVDHPNAQSVKYMFDKDFKHDASKLMFVRWQAQLAPFDFEILYKKGSDNSLPKFYIRKEVITLYQTSYQENTFKMSEYSCNSEIDDIPISLFFTKKRLIIILKILPLNRDLKELICWKIIDGMVTKGRERGNNPRGRGSSSPSSSRSSYGSSSSNTPVIQKGGMSLYNLNSRAQEKASSSIHLEDIPVSDPLYAKLQEFLTQKQGVTFTSIAKDEVDDIKTYEKKREEPWKIIQRYLVNGLYFPEFSVPWIHKWVSKVDFTEEQIPCLYRTYYNNFWDKLMKKDPQTKSIYGQELLDLITKTIKDYKSIPNKGIMTDDLTSAKNMARKISNHDEEEQDEMIMKYLEEVKKKILLNLTHYAKSDSSMRSETSEDMHKAQPYEEERPADALKKPKIFWLK